MRNYTQQTDRIRVKTLMTRAIKVKQGMYNVHCTFNPLWG